MTDPGGGQATVLDLAEGEAVPEPSAPSNIVSLADGNTVTLRPAVTMQLGIAARAAVRNRIKALILSGQTVERAEDVESAVIEGVIAEIYLRLGIESWTFTDAKGQLEPINPDSITRLLPYGRGGKQVAEAADLLYSPEVFPPTPLGPETSKSSPPSPTGGSMSQMNGTGKRHRTPSGQSSRNDTGGKRSGVRGR